MKNPKRGAGAKTDDSSNIGKPSPARLQALKYLLQLDRSGSVPEFHPTHALNFEPRDQALAERLIKGILRRRNLLDAMLQRAAHVGLAKFDPAKTPPTNVWILRLAVYERVFQKSAPDYAIGAEAVALARALGGERSARFINAMVRRMLPALLTDEDAFQHDSWFRSLLLEAQLSIPPEIIRQYELAYGQEAENVLRSLAYEEAATWLRVNILRTTIEASREELNAAGVITETAPAGLPALRWLDGPPPWKTPAWERGCLIVQDLAAQLAAPLLAPAPGETVIDLCAAPGGKTGHLWEMMQGRGRLVACEIDPERRKLLRENLTRLYGPHGIEIPDFNNMNDILTNLDADACDKLLIDAPCQALGLIRRHPEIRWDNRLRTQDAMVASQRSLLVFGARLVRPGGSLLWVTCSPMRAENEELIAAFLAKHSDWQIAQINIPAAFSSPLVVHEGTVRTRPDALAWDAFAYTLLLRKSH